MVSDILILSRYHDSTINFLFLWYMDKFLMISAHLYVE